MRDPYFLHENNRLGFHFKNTPQQVRCLAETRDSVILVGTTKGFYTFDENFSTPESIVFYSSMRQKDDQNSLGSNDIMGIEVTRSGDIYLAVFGGGLNKVLTKNLLSEEISFRPYMKRGLFRRGDQPGRGRVGLSLGTDRTYADAFRSSKGEF